MCNENNVTSFMILMWSIARRKLNAVGDIEITKDVFRPSLGETLQIRSSLSERKGQGFQNIS